VSEERTGAVRGTRKRSEASPERAPLSLREAQERVDAWIAQFEEGYWPPLTNLARLIEEVGELAREMNHRFGHKTKKADEPEQDLALELADVLFVLLVIANEQGIDLDESLARVLDKYRARDAGRWTPAREG
jgi:NTP pyrophosphatase (non-canonical NTP hydrolase)